MSKKSFKPGDQVRVSQTAHHYWNKFGMDYLRGTVQTVVGVDGDGDVRVTKKVGAGTWTLHKDDVSLAEQSWDSLEVGDILLDDDGDERTVYGVAGQVVLTSDGTADEDHDVETWHVERLKRDGWTIKGAKTDDTTELSVAEIEAKLELTPGTLRVKKDA